MTYCSQLLQTNLPTIDLHDKVKMALQEMQLANYSALPVLDGVLFLGMIALADLEDAAPEAEIITIQQLFQKHSVRPNDHFLQALRLRSKFYLDLIPVVNEKQEWEGLIDPEKLLDEVSNMIGAAETGSLLVLEMSRNDYAPGLINRLVESNDAMIMQMNTLFDTNTGSLQVVLRINKEEISDVVATFQRYEYNVLYYYGEETYDNALQKNLDHLFNYLSI
jgi:predicted transcriptional regulator